MPEDAKEAFGHGIRAKRSKSGAVSFDGIDVEANRQSRTGPVNRLLAGQGSDDAHAPREAAHRYG
jgi:hypothetical protein